MTLIAKVKLKVTPANRSHSLEGHTSKCGHAMRLRLCNETSCELALKISLESWKITVS